MMNIEKTKAYQAEVRLRNQRVGVLSRQSAQSYIFKYDLEYLVQKSAVAISIKLPLREKEYASMRLHPFFDNLIMEGWLLHQAEKKFHVDKKNRWSFLMLIGANPIGAVSVHALDENNNLITDLNETKTLSQEINFSVKIPKTNGKLCAFCLTSTKESEDYHLRCYKKLWGTSKALYAKLDKNHPEQTFSKTTEDGSISGAQRKGLFALKRNELVVNSQDSQFILKPNGDYPELPANEHLTMTIAKIFKFNVPPMGLIEIDKLGLVLVIKRFDRTATNTKLLIEDMAQIYEEVSEDKYSLSHEKIAKAIFDYTQAGPLNLQDFFRRVIFCYVTANGDMHLKNWSLLEQNNAQGIYALSPVYDWLNTRIVLKNEKDDLAIPLKGKQRHMQKSYFEKFGIEDLKLNQKYINQVFAEVEAWKQAFEKLIPHSFLSEPMKQAYLKMIKERSQIFN